MSIRMTITERGLQHIGNTIRRYMRRAKGAVGKATGQLAHQLRKEIVTGIRNQAPGGVKFKPLAESTKDRKGSSKALIDHGDMLRSVNVTKLGEHAYFVGINRSVVTKDGKSMANLAEIHEYGSKKVKDRPPARPFLHPSYNAWRYDAEAEWARLVAREIGVGTMIARKFGGVTFGGGG